jgi:ketosteroid isomerase-like protein
MKTRIVYLSLFVVTLSLLPAWLAAQPAAAPEPNAEIHNALRGLRDRVIAAANRRDIDGVLAELHPNVTVTWQNAEVSRGRQGVRAYLERMLKGPNAIVRGYHAAYDVDELTALYGPNTGIAFGSSVETFDLASGEKFTLHGRWSATMVKENGRWLLASLHTSTNLFDNPLLNGAKKALLIGIAVSAVLALLIGWFIGRRTSRAAAQASQSSRG